MASTDAHDEYGPIAHLLVRAGFRVEHVYSDFDRQPYGASYPGDLIFVARKTARS